MNDKYGREIFVDEYGEYTKPSPASRMYFAFKNDQAKRLVTALVRDINRLAGKAFHTTRKNNARLPLDKRIHQLEARLTAVRAAAFRLRMEFMAEAAEADKENGL